jgi:hypothetical protein
MERMMKNMKKFLLAGLLTGAFVAPLTLHSTAARAEYCREYTKTIRVGGHRESGYGTACEQPDGSWMIVSTQGDVDPFDALRNRNVQIVSQEEPVYYTYGPSYRPVTYYAPRRHYYYPSYSPYHSYAQPSFVFSFGNSGWNHGWNHGRNNDWHHHH